VTVVWYARTATAHGEWWIAWTQEGVCLSAPGDRDERRFLAGLAGLHRGAVTPGDPADAPDAFDWRFAPPGFAREALAACAAIPAGEVRSYGELAASCGRPGAARAVGTAMSVNPIPNLVPCHRVVRADGMVGGYGLGGSGEKIEMLRREGVMIEGERLVGTR
jgi:methylated-DNA-[protein]-cysteine S-methyltransferase